MCVHTCESQRLMTGAFLCPVLSTSPNLSPWFGSPLPLNMSSVIVYCRHAPLATGTKIFGNTHLYPHIMRESQSLFILLFMSSISSWCHSLFFLLYVVLVSGRADLSFYSYFMFWLVLLEFSVQVSTFVRVSKRLEISVRFALFIDWWNRMCVFMWKLVYLKAGSHLNQADLKLCVILVSGLLVSPPSPNVGLQLCTTNLVVCGAGDPAGALCM